MRCAVVYCLSTQVYKQAAHKERVSAFVMKFQRACCHLSKQAELKAVCGYTVTAGDILPAVYGPGPNPESICPLRACQWTGAATLACALRQLTSILAVLNGVSFQARVSNSFRGFPFNGEAGVIHIFHSYSQWSAGRN